MYLNSGLIGALGCLGSEKDDRFISSVMKMIGKDDVAIKIKMMAGKIVLFFFFTTCASLLFVCVNLVVGLS